MSRCPIPAQKIRPETRDPFAGSPPLDRPAAESLACPSPVSLGSGAHIIRFSSSGFQHNPHPPPVWSRPTQSKYHQYYRCGSGGTGRSARLRILWPKGRGGSTPLSRTTFPFQNLALPFMKTRTFWSAGACSRFWDGQTFCPNVHVVAPLQPQKRRRAAALHKLAPRPLSLKNHRLVVVQEYPILNVPANRARQHHFLQVAPLLHQILQPIAMRNARHALPDDRPVVQHFRNVVGRRPNQFHPAFVSLLVWFGPHKSRQKRVVNVDDALRVVRNEFR